MRIWERAFLLWSGRGRCEGATDLGSAPHSLPRRGHVTTGSTRAQVSFAGVAPGWKSLFSGLGRVGTGYEL